MLSSVINNRQKRDRDSLLKVEVACDRDRKTTIARCYQTHPLTISRPFRLDALDTSRNKRAYLYLRNNSPGLFSGDRLYLNFNLQDDTQLYLTEQSATKVHPMPEEEISLIDYRWTIGKNAFVEFVPEPIILYRQSKIHQKTQIAIDPTASLFWCDSIVPGRLARGEYYQFDTYSHCLEVFSLQDELLLRDRILLEGLNNSFVDNDVWSKLPILGTAIAIMPQVELYSLKNTLDNLVFDADCLQAAVSVLPHNNGVVIKAFAAKTKMLKSYFSAAISNLRNLNRQPNLPFIPK